MYTKLKFRVLLRFDRWFVTRRFLVLRTVSHDSGFQVFNDVTQEFHTVDNWPLGVLDIGKSRGIIGDIRRLF